MTPNDQAILEIRESIERRRRNRKLAAKVFTLVAIAGALLLTASFAVGCASGPIIAPCPETQCIGPYDLTLSSHREALLR